MMKLLCASLLLMVAVLSSAGERPPVASPPAVSKVERSKPNILWITFEDISPDLGCYGVDYADTPHLDRFAEQGVLYTRAWSNAGMCAPARATLITGMYPPSTGAQNMRSEVILPEYIRGFPEYLRKAGYFTSNHSKHDYNWKASKETWDVNSRDWVNNGWRKRKQGQPFFTVINLTDTHSSQLYWRGDKNYRRRVKELGPDRRHDPDKAPVPPYYPNTPEVRADLARYHDNITYADGIVGRILKQLEDDGLAEDTIVFYYSDHGRGMPRTKGWCFYSSLRVPLIIRFPEKFKHLAPKQAGSKDDRMVSFVDFGPTALSLAGVEPPKHMQGVPFLGEFRGEPRKLAFSYRDRMDERHDLIRSVWDGRYHFIRNYFPHLPWFHHQVRDYPSTQPTYQILHWRHRNGQLNDAQAMYMTKTRPTEMLFDTQADPHEINNLADAPEHAARLKRLRQALHQWQDRILDLGFMPESLWHERYEAQNIRIARHSAVRLIKGAYRLQQARELADRISANDSAAALDALRSPAPEIRFWGITSLHANHTDTKRVREALRQALKDDTATICNAAAHVLADLGETAHTFSVILDTLNHPEPFVALRAANTIDHLGEKARPLLPRIRQFLNNYHEGKSGQRKLGSNFPEWTLRRTMERLEGK